MYTLYLKLEDGTQKLLAQAPGSPYWSEMFYLAVRMYGREHITYTWTDVENGHTWAGRG